MSDANPCALNSVPVGPWVDVGGAFVRRFCDRGRAHHPNVAQVVPMVGPAGYLWRVVDLDNRLVARGTADNSHAARGAAACAMRDHGAVIHGG